MSTLCTLCIIVLIVGVLVTLRLFYCIKYPTKPLPKSKKGTKKFITMVVLGSGGHTSEILTTLKNLDYNIYCPIHYVAAKTDKHSLERAKNSHNDDVLLKNIFLHRIYRSREVRQSWITTIFTTFYSLIESFILCFIKVRPDIIICNGPGTCIPILICGLFLRVLFIKPKIKLIFLESFCRVDDLSMTGKIAYKFVNLFIVQYMASIFY